LKVKFFLLRRLVGVKSDTGARSDRVRKIVEGETLMINVGSTSTGAKIISIQNVILKEEKK
jgi:translation initiation factor 2 subunit 3